MIEDSGDVFQHPQIAPQVVRDFAPFFCALPFDCVQAHDHLLQILHAARGLGLLQLRVLGGAFTKSVHR